MYPEDAVKLLIDCLMDHDERPLTRRGRGERLEMLQQLRREIEEASDSGKATGE